MTFGRRRFLAGTGLVVAAAALGSCTDGGDGESADSPDGGRPSEADLDFLELAAGLEALAVETYQGSLDAAAGGKLGEVPAAGSEFLQVAHDQHDEALAALNGILESGDREPVANPNTAARESVVEPGLASATDFLSVARVVRNLESALAATYLRAVQSDLQVNEIVRAAAGIQATGQKRVAVLSFMIGEFPSPDPFQRTDAAITA